MITIRTTRSDKYDRYLADVHLAPAAAGNHPPRRDGYLGAGAEVSLNNALLEKAPRGEERCLGVWGLLSRR